MQLVVVFEVVFVSLWVVDDGGGGCDDLTLRVKEGWGDIGNMELKGLIRRRGRRERGFCIHGRPLVGATM